MPKQTIRQNSAENPYYHPDFHIAFNYGIEYLRANFGAEAVIEYLANFAKTYYAPLKEALLSRGLIALKEHYEKIYSLENAVWDMKISPDELEIHLTESPAVVHIKNNGHPVSPSYCETVNTVNMEICRHTPFGFQVVEYQADNGAYRLRFFKT